LAGADENTTIEFSDEVSVEGSRSLGVYGLYDPESGFVDGDFSKKHSVEATATTRRRCFARGCETAASAEQKRG
jgi:hypothetical protein